MNDTSSNQELCDRAYGQVLKDMGLPLGTKLHEEPDRIRLWQYWFKLFREPAETVLLPEAA